MARPSVAPDKPLTPLEAAFVREYAIDRNGQQAAIRAGAKPASAKVTASRWLDKANVRAALANISSKAVQRANAKADTERAILTAEAIATEAWRIATDTANPAAARVSALTLVSKQFPEFSDKIDARVLHGVVSIERGTKGLT